MESLLEIRYKPLHTPLPVVCGNSITPKDPSTLFNKSEEQTPPLILHVGHKEVENFYLKRKRSWFKALFSLKK